MKKILIMDDDFSVRESLQELLRGEGFQILWAIDGATGIKTAQNSEPDLILCDLLKSDLDGYQVLSRIRESLATQTIPFIFLSTESELLNFRKAMTLGADDYLTKPFRREDLLAAIKSQFQKKAAFEQKYQTQNFEAINYDQLTGLPNRLLIRQQFENLQNADFLAILCVSLDRFQELKDYFGYEVGESLLKQAVTRFKSVISSQDTLAYLSTNEFLIILTEASNTEETITVTEKVLSVFQPSFSVEEQEFSTTLSIGISFYPEHSREIDLLLKQSHKGKKSAEKKGGNCYHIYQPSLNKCHSDYTITLETDLRYALEKQELVLYYQPRVSLVSGEIVGMEALLRWFHPQLGTISPKQFIPIAEETGLIIPISDWVSEMACQQGKTWQNWLKRPLKMAINFSAQGFQLSDFCERIEAICQRTQFPFSCLELELTESTLVKDFLQAREKLQQLQTLGIDVAIDDFGTGYSSLNYLQQFSFQILKLDRTFVRNSGRDTTNRAIVSSLIQLAHNLQLSVVAEGVERQCELNFLREQNCEEIQGYLFSPPLSAREMEDLLREKRRLPS
ncbi:putative bifunctional diguanylate cyclase/phosphodiesterase [Dactylococcopsis salina]|uniref:Diguanylate cyclase (GGDEF) domain-containing protein n=1 Tax=Dactylococcopsis salina (strain PCC 8305) TaxID=13035 RepID=K9YQ03_DACS8|nr:EAL domain-containing response regulator [Dactylococcopsis salina]AFZ49011.1 diguanylate cyclase (GGDEF) domain-containing protein [Dactylococcopsis salina PCC 8305]